MNTAAVPAALSTECVIIGAGPSACCGVRTRLIGIKCEIVDSLPTGGQCTELYTTADLRIPAAGCGAKEIVDRLLEQTAFHAGFHMGQEGTGVTPSNRAVRDREVMARVLIRAASSSRPDSVPSSAAANGSGSGAIFEGTRSYRVRRAEDFHGKDIVVAGGGDSALDGLSSSAARPGRS